jgi:hypothetical protein
VGFRFRRRLRIVPGLHLNLSRSGISATVGVPGLRVTLGKRPALNVGLPGTGISYRESLGGAPPERPGPPAALPGQSVHVHWLWVTLILVIVIWAVLGRVSTP